MSFADQSKIDELVNKYAPETSNSKVHSTNKPQFETSQPCPKALDKYPMPHVHPNPSSLKKPNELSPDYDEPANNFATMQKHDPLTGNVQLSPLPQDSASKRLNFGPLNPHQSTLVKSAGDHPNKVNENFWCSDDSQSDQRSYQSFGRSGDQQSNNLINENENLYRTYEPSKGSKGSNQSSSHISPNFVNPVYQRGTDLYQERPMEEQFEMKFNPEHGAKIGITQSFPAESIRVGERNKSSAMYDNAFSFADQQAMKYNEPGPMDQNRWPEYAERTNELMLNKQSNAISVYFVLLSPS